MVAGNSPLSVIAGHRPRSGHVVHHGHWQIHVSTEKKSKLAIILSKHPSLMPLEIVKKLAIIDIICDAALQITVNYFNPLREVGTQSVQTWD